MKSAPPLAPKDYAYAYVHLRSTAGNTGMKVFYTAATRLSTFLLHLKSRGEIRRVDFGTLPLKPITLSELQEAEREGRIIN